jgi:Choline/Carnitine o-acyltransferase
VLKAGESHPIFTDRLFSKSSKWQLSTSALFSGERVLGTGFGAAYNDGYGMNYMIAAKGIKIGVESKNSCKDTSSHKFCETLDGVFKDMKTLCDTQTEAKL